MAPHEERVVVEEAELGAKTQLLCNFIQSEKFTTVDAKQQELLKEQYDAMNWYRTILQKRIELF